MLPDRVSNPGPLTYESGALPIALRGPARLMQGNTSYYTINASSFSERSFICFMPVQTLYWNDFVVALLFYVHGKHLRSCRDGQLT